MASGELDSSSGIPLYRQIKDLLRDEIAVGEATDTPLTEAQLLVRFGVSRAPIRQALKELADEGYVYRRQGKGTFPVPGARVQRPATVKPGDLYRYLADQGLKTTSTVLDLARLRPPERVRRLLQLDKSERPLHFTRLIAVDGEVLIEDELYVRAPKEFAPTVVELEQAGSAFQLLERDLGIAIQRAENQAWATTAGPDRAQLMHLPEGSPLLAIETTFFAVGGLPMGWRLSFHQAEKFKFQFVTGD